MALILCIETATTNCSVAIFKNNELIAIKEDRDKNYSHAEKLHVFIEQLLMENGLLKENLDAVAVSKGPGSYTGLRIGVSAAKGLCFALDIPLISINTLGCLANQVEGNFNSVFPMLDARRMEVYVAGFNTSGEEIMPTSAKILDEESFSGFFKFEKICFVGSGAEKLKSVYKGENAVFQETALPSAEQMGADAFSKFKKSDFEDVAYFEPFYLKDFMLG